METTNLTDITNLTDAALDVFLRVKGGEEVVTVDHLTPVERRQVVDALRVKASSYWINNPPVQSPPRHRLVEAVDYEALILEEQEDDGRNL